MQIGNMTAAVIESSVFDLCKILSLYLLPARPEVTVLKKRSFLALIWVMGAAIVAELVVLLAKII